jgi:poly-gamma-glutamate capsule biosynthesis protein CapA/YwtB (metallophosphatase superfamily)
MKKILIFLIALLAVLFAAGCQLQNGGQKDGGNVAAMATIQPAIKTPESTDAPVSSASASALSAVQKATIAAVGDVMLMSTQINDAKKGDTYDFNPVFSLIAPYIQKADIAVANLETPVAGEEAGWSVSGTPMPDGKTGLSYFNAPVQILDALKEAGFDVLGTANNHALDKDRDGLENTIRNIRAAGLEQMGTNLPGEGRRMVIKEANGIKFAILAYAEGVNQHTGGYNGSELSQAVNFINDKNVIADIKQARQDGADIVAICLHTGVEKNLAPESYERERAKAYIAAGADILFQSHPHVLQPFEMVTTGEGTAARTGLVAYSLGNFISNMDGDVYARSVVVYADVEKDANGAHITGARYLPTYFYRNGGTYEVLPTAPSAIPAVGQALGAGAAKTAEGAYERTVDFLGNTEAVPEQ